MKLDAGELIKSKDELEAFQAVMADEGLDKILDSWDVLVASAEKLRRDGMTSREAAIELGGYVFDDRTRARPGVEILYKAMIRLAVAKTEPGSLTPCEGTDQ